MSRVIYLKTTKKVIQEFYILESLQELNVSIFVSKLGIERYCHVS